MSPLFPFMAECQEQDHFSVRGLCRALEVGRSGYYLYQGGILSQRRQRDRQLVPLMEKIFWHHRRRYGARRVHRELLRQGWSVGLNRVRRMMKAQGLRPLQKRRFVPRTTERRAGSAGVPNRLLDHPALSRINQVWVADITYLPLVEGWAYLAEVMDLYSRKIVGWALEDHLREELVLASLGKAMAQRHPPAGLLVHSDQGSQYTSQSMGNFLHTHQLIQSLSRPGNCYDNAFMESCFGTFKTELLEDGIFSDLSEARMETFDYIEGYYNTQRLHSSLGYQSPEEFEQAQR